MKKMADKDKEKTEQPEEGAEMKTDEKEVAEINRATGLPIGPKWISIRPDLIGRVSYGCENPQCAQVMQVGTVSVPLHCSFCGGPISIVNVLVRGEYTPEELETIRQQQAQQQAQAQAAAQAQQAQAQAPVAPGGRLRPIRRQ